MCNPCETLSRLLLTRHTGIVKPWSCYTRFNVSSSMLGNELVIAAFYSVKSPAIWAWPHDLSYHFIRNTHTDLRQPTVGALKEHCRFARNI